MSKSWRQIVQNENIKSKHLHGRPDHRNGYNILDKKLNLSDLPPDVLYEIFRLLEPSDLLHLSRSNKSIRYVVLSRSAVRVWKNSLALIPNLPTCPEEMSLPSWAHLCFSSYCHTCFTEGIDNINWELRMRVCDNCFHSKVKLLPPEGCSLVWGCHWDNLVSCFKKMRRLYCLRQEYDQVLQHVQSLESDDAALVDYIGSRVKSVYNRKRVYFPFPFLGFLLTYSGFIPQVIPECKAWYTTYLKEENKRKGVIRSQRLRFIIQKLKELPWEFDIKDTLCSTAFKKELKQHNLVHKPMLLTEESWNDIKAPIIEVVKQLEQKHFDLARRKRPILSREILSERYRDFCKKRFSLYCLNRLPHLEDIMEFPSFKEVINRSPKSIAARITIAEFDDAMSELKALLVSWMEEQEILALSMIQSKVTDDFISLGIQIPTEPFDLMLATNMFCCKGCQDAIDFRRMARHQHAYKSPGEGLLPLQRSPWDLLCDVPHGGFPNVYYSPRISKMAAWVVSTCNLDPATTTIDEMDALDPWFECNVCQRDSGGELAARNWRFMVNHRHDCFRLLDKDEMAQVRSFLESHSDVDMWCTYCDNVIPFHGRGDHLRRKHQLDRPVEPDDYIRPTICSPIPSTRIMVYPSKVSAK